LQLNIVLIEITNLALPVWETNWMDNMVLK